MLLREDRNDVNQVLNHTQADALVTACRKQIPPLLRALRIRSIRQAIEAGRYETPQRIDAATEALMQALLEVEPDRSLISQADQAGKGRFN